MSATKISYCVRMALSLFRLCLVIELILLLVPQDLDFIEPVQYYDSSCFCSPNKRVMKQFCRGRGVVPPCRREAHEYLGMPPVCAVLCCVLAQPGRRPLQLRLCPQAWHPVCVSQVTALQNQIKSQVALVGTAIRKTSHHSCTLVHRHTPHPLYEACNGC